MNSCTEQGLMSPAIIWSNEDGPVIQPEISFPLHRQVWLPLGVNVVQHRAGLQCHSEIPVVLWTLEPGVNHRYQYFIQGMTKVQYRNELSWQLCNPTEQDLRSHLVITSVHNGVQRVLQRDCMWLLLHSRPVNYSNKVNNFSQCPCLHMVEVHSFLIQFIEFVRWFNAWCM
jgi:hypothetical protein